MPSPQKRQNLTVPCGFHAPPPGCFQTAPIANAQSAGVARPSPPASIPAVAAGGTASQHRYEYDRGGPHYYNVYPYSSSQRFNTVTVVPPSQTTHLEWQAVGVQKIRSEAQSNLHNSGSSGEQLQNSRKRNRAEFSCLPCGIFFDSLSALSSHEASHAQCPECTFRASPKVVKGHHQASHGKFSGSGFKVVTISVPGCPVQRFRICVGNRPEDVQQWIAERRKRFPRRSGTTNSQSTTTETRNLVSSNSNGLVHPVQEKIGLSSLLDGYGSSSSSNHDDESHCCEEGSKSPTRSLTAISPNANSEGRSDERTEETLVDIKQKPCHFFARNGKCRNGDQCRFSHDLANRSDIRSSQHHPDSSSRNLDRSRPNSNRSISLLEKLLVNDVRRERLLTIQLLEHIVDSDFLTTKLNQGENHN